MFFHSLSLLFDVEATKMIASNSVTAWFPYPSASEVSREVANFLRFSSLWQLGGCVPAFRLGVPPRYRANKL